MANYIADEIKLALLEGQSNNDIAKEILTHYGMPRRSGRYPWGSGKESYQHSKDFLARIDEMKKDGFTFTDSEGKTYSGDDAIYRYLGMSSTEYRMQKQLANIERRSLLVDRAKSLKEDGLGVNEIARRMGKPESTIRSLLDEDAEAKMRAIENTKNFIKTQVDQYGMVDVGKGAEIGLNVSRTKMDTAIYALTGEGYEYRINSIPQVNNKNQNTVQQVLCAPGTPKGENYKWEKVHMMQDDFISDDGGETFRPTFVKPASMDGSRLMVNYATPDGKGGALKDGVIELRRGVKDLDLGDSHYAQVRILVNGTHYLKGMAVYADDLPDGIDVRFNTNKTKDVPVFGTDKLNTVLKKAKPGENPFGSAIKEGIFDPTDPDSDKGGGQSYYIDKNGKKQLSLINKREDEGGWIDWSDKLPSQFLGKQSLPLIKRQLNITEKEKVAELDEIKSVTNPVVRRALLKSFADSCDSSAEHLKATSLPGQKWEVILPLTSIKDNEVYAPNFKQGETVALVRYPHGGTFEIPIVTVNNKNAEGNRVITKNAKDAIGISKAVADRLSGADFDGDTVMVIPCNSASSKTKIVSRELNIKNPINKLEGFDPKVEYGGRKDGTFKKMTNTNLEMGKISNLITDMTIRGASDDEIARAVKHSMVVIDAEKHGLDYKQSEKDNGIAELKKKYQGHYDLKGEWKDQGASTLLSRAKNEETITKRKGTPRPDPETGKLIYKEDYQEYYTIKDPSRNNKQVTAYQKDDGNWYHKDKDKNEIKIDDPSKLKLNHRTQKVTQMSMVDDARMLSTGTPQEEAYAAYANKLKSLANDARKESIAPKNRQQYDPTAAVKYKDEVKSLSDKLDKAKAHAPIERQAQRMANSRIEAMKADHPDMDKDEIKKRSQQEISNARAKLGGKRERMEITDKEWTAIQAGAITDNKLMEIVTIVGADTLKPRALPKRERGTTTTRQQSMIRTLANNGYTNAEIAKRLGISVSTVTNYL